jgi:hypothetical protein
MGLNHRYRTCETCGALGHGGKGCPLYRLEEQKQALSPPRPRLTVREPSDPAVREATSSTLFLRTG